MNNTSFLNNTLANPEDYNNVIESVASDPIAGGSVLGLAGMCNPDAFSGTGDTLVRLEDVKFANNGSFPSMLAQKTPSVTAQFTSDNSDHIVHSFDYPKFCTEPAKMSDLTPGAVETLSPKFIGKFINMNAKFIQEAHKV